MSDVMISGTVFMVVVLCGLVYAAYWFYKATKDIEDIEDPQYKYNKLEVHGVVRGSPIVFPSFNDSESRYEIISNRHLGERIIQFDDGTCYPLPVHFYVQRSLAKDDKQITFSYKGKYLGSVSTVGGLDNFKRYFDEVYQNHILNIIEDNSEIRWSGGNSDVKYQDPEFFKGYSGLAELMNAVKVDNARAA